MWLTPANILASADPEGGPRVRTPLRFVRGGVLCRGLMGRRGVQQLFLPYYYQFFSGSLRSLVLYNHISTCIHTSKSNVHYGTVILSLYFPYPNHEKIPTSHPLVAFIKGHFHIYLLSKYTILHQFSQKISGGGSPNRLLDTFTISKLPSSVCL